jgi:hypothetical protein
MNIVSLITCKATGLSYVGATKNGKLDPDSSTFNPLRYGFGALFRNAVRRFGKNAFTIQVLGSGYATRRELDLAQKQFIETYGTMAPNGYNIREGRDGRPEYGADFREAAIRRSTDPEWRSNVCTANELKAFDPRWRRANAVAGKRRAESAEWQIALEKRSENVEWRRKISSARRPYLHLRWHVRRGIVPPDTTVETCNLCKLADHPTNWQPKNDVKNSQSAEPQPQKREPTTKPETLQGVQHQFPREEELPFTLEEELDYIKERVEVFYKENPPGNRF